MKERKKRNPNRTTIPIATGVHSFFGGEGMCKSLIWDISVASIFSQARNEENGREEEDSEEKPE
jgi:hypothetical protein